VNAARTAAADDGGMSNLVAIAYDDLEQAKQVTGTLGELVKEHSLTLEDCVIVEHRPGAR
jgi:uncharacterized membrane protein